ncbi:MAG: electron transport complex subunit RsxC [Clostridia bacterium]|nr:electron transport complex subunit RsxC [Clostridia bacterium]
MKKRESILRPVQRIKGGVNLPHLKATAEKETVVMPAPKIVNIPMSQHIGAPANPCVSAGDKVFVGTLIGEANGFVSANIHSSVSGTVKSVGEVIMNGLPSVCVTIESDGEMEKDPNLKPFKVEKAEDLAEAARACGLVGLGGAGFPASVKLTPNPKQKLTTLVVNGAECEPYITSDYRECIENYNDVLEGIYLIKRVLGLKRVRICIESNKDEAIKKLYEIASDRRDPKDKVKLMRLPEKYPQGAEKVIVYSATGRKVGPGKLPSDAKCIVMNITSIGTLYRFITTGMPLVSKRITVDGTAVSDPKNVIVPIGTSIAELLDFVGEIDENASKILMGGPMMGIAMNDKNAVVEKRNNGITVMKEAKPLKTTPCIRCGRCVQYCPMNLFPAMVEAAALKNNVETIKTLNVNACMECGSCSYVCPAKRPLVQSMRLAKAQLRRESK